MDQKPAAASRVEAEKLRLFAALVGAAALAGRFDQAFFEKIADDLGDRRLAQTRLAGDLADA